MLCQLSQILAILERDFGRKISVPPKISPISYGDSLFCLVRAYKHYPKARPAKRYPRAVVVSLNVFLLSGLQFKASFGFAPLLHDEGTHTITKVSVHDLRKLHSLFA